MAKLVTLVEGLLHGEYHGRDFLRRDKPIVSAGMLIALIWILGALYGACMALYGVKWGQAYGRQHVIAVMIKVPSLFLLTLLVTCPSLYAFSSLGGSTLGIAQTLRVLLASVALSLAVLASFAPVTAFFRFCTESHPFMQLLNAALFTVSGLVGMQFLRRRLAEALEASDDADANARYHPRLTRILLTWFVIYGVVAAQMGWMLRPFVGSRDLPQELFRDTEHNIFHGLGQALQFLDH